MDDLFDECCNNEKYREPVYKTSALIDKLVADSEAEFTGASSSHVDREREKKELSDTIKSLEVKLSKLKNPANTAKLPFEKRSAITKKLSEERDEIRKRIRQCKVRLDEIELETPKKEDNPSNVERNTRSNIKWGSNNPYNELM